MEHRLLFRKDLDTRTPLRTYWFLNLVLQILHRSIAVFTSAAVRLYGILAGTFVLLKVLHLFRVHVLHDRVGLPLLE